MMTAAPPQQATKVPEIRKGDTVVVLTGKDAGKRGVVDRDRRATRRAWPRRSRSRRRRLAHVSPLSAGVGRGRGHQHRQAPHQAAARPSSRPTGCPRSSRAASSRSPSRCRSARSWSSARAASDPTRVKHTVLDNGQRVRVCSHCGERLEVKA